MEWTDCSGRVGCNGGGDDVDRNVMVQRIVMVEC